MTRLADMTPLSPYVGVRPSPSASGVAAEGGMQTENASATPPNPPQLGSSTSTSGRQHHRNCSHLPHLRDHPIGSSRNSTAAPASSADKKTKEIANALYIAAKENSAKGIHDFASGQLEHIPANHRLAWLRKLGADKAMRETMRNGSAETIVAWTAVVALPPAMLLDLKAELKKGELFPSKFSKYK